MIKLFTPARVFALALLLASLASQNSLAQTVSASPASLSFGIPTGTSPAVSAAENVTVNITGSGSVSFTGVSVSAGSPFTVVGNSCQNTLTAPTTCTISITLTTTSTNLQTDTVLISYGTDSSLIVPLSGAYGAIKLWDETNVTASVSTASFTNLYTIASAGLSLSCPANPTATLSNTPGTFPVLDTNTLGYVLVDNYVTLAINGSVVDTGNYPAGNVCSGGPADFFNGNSYNDCFSTNYQAVAGNDYGLNGLDPDTFTNPGNAVLTTIQYPNTNNAGGVPPINVSTYFPSNSQVQALFTAVDSGYVYTSSTVFLVTNCSPVGIIPGGSVTLNPINTANPSSETQTATLSNSPNQNISLTTSVAVAAQNGYSVPTGIVPTVTDIGVPQSLFSQLVSGPTGTSAAPAVCLRLAGELDIYGQPMCKGFLVQCYNPATGTTTGDNCAPTLSTLRDIYNAVQFASPDAPPGYNFLTTQPWTPSTSYNVGQTIVDKNGYVQVVTTAGTSGLTTPSFNENVGQTTSGDGSVVWLNQGLNACANVATWGTGIACAPGTGPGMLMGSDNWLCAPGDTSPCTPLEPNTSTTGTTYSDGNCQLTGILTGNLCPMDLLTQFLGAADERDGGTAPITNSIFVPVVNLPLPTASAAITGQNGWINNPSAASATFTSNAAAYPNSASAYPPRNAFVPAAPFSLTYGLSAWPTLPDTTYPVAGDLTNYNQYTSANPNPNATPPTTFCNNNGTTPSAFSSSTAPGFFSGLQDGIYNLHYFATDCAFTEGLVFAPTTAQLTNPTANWASFPFVTFGIDTAAPALSSCGAPPAPIYTAGTQNWYKTSFSIQCTVTDSDYSPGASGSGFLPLTNGIQGSPSEPVTVYANAPPAPAVSSVYALPAAPVCDLAGNCVPNSTVWPGPFNFDTQPPTITVAIPSTGSTYAANQKVYASYSCSDGAGSGVKTCGGTVANGAAIDTVPNGVSTPKTFAVNSTDNVGNPATDVVNYSVSCHYVSFAVNPTSVNPGGIIIVTANIMDCTSTSQSISLEFIWTGPVGKSCTSTKTVMLTTPYFTIPAGTSESVSFPYVIPTNACAATHTLTTDTFINKTQVDSTTVSLTVK